MTKQLRLNPTNIVLLYGAVAVSWILFSDVIVLELRLPSYAAFILNATKGALFVATTMLILYFLLRRMMIQSAEIQREHEAELRQSEERFSKAFHSSPEGMTIATLEDGRYIETNDAFLTILGYERNELLGYRSSDIWARPEHRAELLKSLNADAPVRSFNTLFRHKSGTTVEVEVSAERIQLQGRPCLLGITRDLSEHRKLERQFQLAQKMEALGQLAARIAHDFRNQLMVINANAQVLRELDDENRKRRSHILSAVQKSELLTQQLLAYSRRQETQAEVLNLSATVGEIGTMIPNLLSKAVRLETALDADWSICADRGQLEQVMMNLAVNAGDAMPRGGTLRIETSNLKLDSAIDSEMVTVPKGEYVQMVVSDTGEGMTDTTRARLFEPFFTTKQRGKGTGLGLAAVYGIVKQSGGYILVESQLGVGSKFVILFPRRSERRQGDLTGHPERSKP